MVAYNYTSEQLGDALRGLGYLQNNEPLLEGVKKFKQDYGFGDDAILNDEVRMKVAEIVFELKLYLNLVADIEKPLGRNPESAHLYGSRTTEAVRQFQKIENLDETGIAARSLLLKAQEKAKQKLKTIEKAWILVTKQNVNLMSSVEDRKYYDFRPRDWGHGNDKEFKAENLPAEWFARPRNLIVNFEKEEPTWKKLP